MNEAIKKLKLYCHSLSIQDFFLSLQPTLFKIGMRPCNGKLFFGCVRSAQFAQEHYR